MNEPMANAGDLGRALEALVSTLSMWLGGGGRERRSEAGNRPAAGRAGASGPHRRQVAGRLTVPTHPRHMTLREER